MGLFDLFKKKKVVTEPAGADRTKPSGGHNSHWEIALGDPDSVEKKTAESISEPDKTDEALDKSTTACYKALDDALTIITITEKGLIHSAYPENTKTIKYSSTVNKVTEWQNSTEAWVECTVQRASLSFFPTDYYKNRDKYASGQNLDIGYSAFAYKVSAATDEEICAILPHPKSRFPDDYWFQGEIKDIITLPESTVYKTRLINIGGDDYSFDVWIYCLNKNIQGAHNIGDRITGMLWLQGRI